MLREYNTKAQTILACKIEETGTVDKIKPGEYKYQHRGRGASKTLLVFATSPKQTPKPGDYIIQFSKENVYLCSADVFNAKYNPKSMVIK